MKIGDVVTNKNEIRAFPSKRLLHAPRTQRGKVVALGTRIQPKYVSVLWTDASTPALAAIGALEVVS